MQLELPFDECAVCNNILICNRRRYADDIILALPSSFGFALPWRRSRVGYFGINALFLFGRCL